MFFSVLPPKSSQNNPLEVSMEPQNGFLYFHPELYLRNPFLDEVEWVSSIEEVD